MFHVKHFQRIPDMPLNSHLSALLWLHNPVSTVCACKKISPSQGLQGRFCGICSKMSGSLTGSNLGLFTAENPASRQIPFFTGKISE